MVLNHRALATKLRIIRFAFLIVLHSSFTLCLFYLLNSYTLITTLIFSISTFICAWLLELDHTSQRGVLSGVQGFFSVEIVQGQIWVLPSTMLRTLQFCKHIIFWRILSFTLQHYTCLVLLIFREVPIGMANGIQLIIFFHSHERSPDWLQLYSSPNLCIRWRWTSRDLVRIAPTSFSKLYLIGKSLQQMQRKQLCHSAPRS